jgi:hypothetical protein
MNQIIIIINTFIHININIYKNFGGNFVLLDSVNSTNFAKFLEKFAPIPKTIQINTPPPPPPGPAPLPPLLFYG